MEAQGLPIGIKPFLREVGQIFEASNAFISTNSSQINEFNANLARTVAELFAEGTSLEILDCKTRQVPMDFLKAVFRNLKEMVDGKIFILSAIGIQVHSFFIRNILLENFRLRGEE